MTTYNTFATWEQYIIYLRKSRQDDPRETVEEVLEKHETILQEFAVREFGHKIPEKNIYREVVSGESISDREEIQAVLARLNDPNIKGVLVVEPSRLSRGDLTDCGHLIDAFRYSKTLVVTPYMTYDLEKKMERKFFQDELLRGNDYLEYTKEILWRGRVAAAKRGCYSLGCPAPFGYKKIKIEKDWTLEIVPEKAEVVRQIFDWYVREGLTPGAVARRLNQMGVLDPSQKNHWTGQAIRRLLANEHYRGMIVFNQYKRMTFYENGEKVKHKVKQKEEDVVRVKGKHPAIIDDATFQAAQELITPKPRTKEEAELRNPFASVLRCGVCGVVMTRNGQPTVTRYICRQHSPICVKTLPVEMMHAAIVSTLENSELPALQLKIKNDEGNAIKIQQRAIDKLQNQLIEFEGQEEKLFELLETNVYTAEMFTKRHSALAAKIENCREELEKARRALPKSIDYQERAAKLEEAIQILKDPTATPEEQNKVVKAIVERIDYLTPPPADIPRGQNPFSLKVFLRL